MTRNDVELADVAQTRNQRATASVIADAFINTSDVYFNLVGLSADGARKAFDSLSGEAHPSSLSAAVQHGDNLRRNLIERLDLPAEGLVMWARVSASGQNSTPPQAPLGFMDETRTDSVWVWRPRSAACG